MAHCLMPFWKAQSYGRSKRGRYWTQVFRTKLIKNQPPICLHYDSLFSTRRDERERERRKQWAHQINYDRKTNFKDWRGRKKSAASINLCVGWGYSIWLLSGEQMTNDRWAASLKQTKEREIFVKSGRRQRHVIDQNGRFGDGNHRPRSGQAKISFYLAERNGGSISSGNWQRRLSTILWLDWSAIYVVRACVL